MKKGTNKNRLNGKDLMNVGIFTAINAIVGVLIAVAIGLTPIGFMLIPFVAAIILGIPMMLSGSWIMAQSYGDAGVSDGAAADRSCHNRE